MRIARRCGALLTATLLAACTPAAPEPSPTPAPSPTTTTTTATVPATSPTPSLSLSPSPVETLDPGQIAARDVVLEFFRLSGELRKDPSLPLQPLANITTGIAQEAYLKEIIEIRQANARQVGDILVVLREVGPVRIGETDKAVTVQVCSDNSTADLIDQSTGKSVLPPDRQIFIHWFIDATSSGARWLVQDISTKDVDSCVGN